MGARSEEDQERVRRAVADLVEPPQALDGPREDAAAERHVDVFGGVAREARDDVDAVAGQKVREVLLVRLREHGQVAAVDHVDVGPERLGALDTCRGRRRRRSPEGPIPTRLVKSKNNSNVLKLRQISLWF